MLMMRASVPLNLSNHWGTGEERARACGAPKRRPTAQKQAQLMLMMRASVSLNLSNHWGALAPKRRPTAQKQAQLMLMMRASVSLHLSNHWGTGLLVVKKELEPAEPQNAGRLPKSRPS